MTIDYKALAERIELYASLGVEGCDRWRDDLRTVATMLEGMADEKPALWMQSNHVSWAGKQPFMARCAPTQLHPDFVPVYLHPAPQPQPTEAHPMLCATHYCKDCAALWRQCDDFTFTLRSQACCTACNNAPVGGQLFALTTPVARPSEPTEAQIEVARPYGTDTMSEMGIVPMCDEPGQPVSESRPCTCHPDDNPPVPCAQKYALNECRAASEPTETEIEARDALLDFISENGTASEGVQHYLDRYVRAALAAKE